MKYPKQNPGAKRGGSIYIVMNKEITKTPQFREDRPDNTIYIPQIKKKHNMYIPSKRDLISARGV